MNRRPFVPSRPAAVDAVFDGDHWSLVFVRDLAHPPAQVWAALTDPGQLREWSAFRSDRHLGRSERRRLR